MVRFLTYFFAVIFAGQSNIVSSQNEVKKWYFGRFCALDFSTNPPTNLANGAMSTWEGCASAADASGNLLFYTNGVKIWNQSHLVMANGTGLLGDNSSNQSALIVKQPGSSTIYFVFTTDGGAYGLNYSVVDMSLAAGMGSVTVKNSQVSASSTERLCGTPHCNGTDIWVVSHDNSSDVFRANLVTATGVNTTAVLSAVGTPLYSSNRTGSMKISPNGKKLGMSLYRLPYSFELFDFNTSTGVVSNSLSLPVISQGYGCEFSPDGTKFYGTLFGAGSLTNRLRQWDLCAGSNQAIIASERSFDATHTGQLQLAPDGKIYQARAVFVSVKIAPMIYVDQMQGEPMLGVIHNPNAGAASLNFNNTGQGVGPQVSMFGLPNFVSGFYKTPVAQFTYNVNPAVSCVKAFFTAPPLINATCSATSYTVNSVTWLFDDVASGTANSSTLVNPQHTYPGIGTYKVRLILYNTCGGVIDTLKQEVEVGRAWTNNSSDFSMCSGQSLTLVAASSSGSYTWSTGATSSSIVVTPTTNTTYSLGYTDAFGCPHESMHTATVNAMPPLSVLGKDSVCAGGSATLIASGATTYSWSTGSTSSSIKVTPPVSTSYTVTGTSLNGCAVKKVVTAFIKPAPVPVVIGNTVLCTGSVATATVISNPGDKYQWNTGTIGTTFSVIPTEDQYIFSVKATYANGCSRYNNLVKFKLLPVPYVMVAGINTVCAGAAITLTASGAITYSWSNGQTTNFAKLVSANTTTYAVIGTGTNNCATTVTFFVVVKPSAFSSASVSANASICEGESIVLTASGGNQYEWKPAPLSEARSNTLVATPSVSTVYSVDVSFDNVCGTTKTVKVSVKPAPKLWAGRDTVFDLEEPMFITASGTGTITWIAGDGIACPDCPSTRVFPVVKTCYLAQALNTNGCKVIDEVCIDIGTEYAVYIPNTFTPDDDGLNDEFYISGFGISDLRLSIFNRAGEKIFSSNNETVAWNGSFKEKPCQAGTYIWLLDYLSAKGRRQQKTGHVNLLRYK